MRSSLKMQRTPPRPGLTPGEASLVGDGTSGGGWGDTEPPGRGQYSLLSEKLSARRKLGKQAEG